jgi:ribonuclease R
MLPRHLSEDSLSLLPGEERDALTVEFQVDVEGVVTSVECYESRIRSDLRLSYDLVAEILTGRRVDLGARLTQTWHSASITGAAVNDSIRWLRTAAARLGSDRQRRGGFDAGRTDPELVVNPVGEPQAYGRRAVIAPISPETAAAHRLIECLMVAANESVAGWLVSRSLPGIFRTHAGPDADGVAEISAFCEHLGFHTGLTTPLSPRALAAVEEQLTFAGNGTDAANDLWQILVRNMPHAEYTTTPGEHFGLGSDGYLHFTSPIRRYADLCVHRVIKANLAGERDMAPLAADLSGVVGHINDCAAAAKRAENQLRRMLWVSVIADAIDSKPNKVFTGRVVSVSARDLRVVLDGTAAWGKVKFASLPGNWYNSSAGVASATTQGKVKKLCVGDIVSCRVQSANPVNSEMILEIVTEQS